MKRKKRDTGKDKAEAAIEQIEASEDTDEIIRMNAEFHRILYQPAGRPAILLAVDQLRSNLERYLRLAWQELNYLPASQAEHRKMLRLFRRGDEDKVAAAIAAHIAATGQVIIKYLDGRAGSRARG